MENVKKKNSKYLVCGCCGKGFNTWKGYQDQDQDTGFGICKTCQRDARIKERRFINETIERIKPNLSQENLDKINAMSNDEKKYVVMKLIDAGVLYFKIKK